MLETQRLQRAAEDFFARAGGDPQLSEIASQLKGVLSSMASPGARAVRAIKIEIEYGSGDKGNVIDAQPNHAGQIPTDWNPDE